MNPQIIIYDNGNSHEITRLEDSNTFLVKSSNLQWGFGQWPPIIFISGIEKKKEKIKFDFFKAYVNAKKEVNHCEYRSIDGEKYKLIVHV